MSSLIYCGLIFVCYLKNTIMFTIEKVPKRKCGAETVALGILGGGSILGTLGSFATNKSNQMYGSSESAAARKWSTNERLAAQEYNTQERLAVQEYNNPVNQMNMARAAGLNPNALGSGVSFVGSQPQSSSSGTAPISSIGTSQVPNIPQLISSGSELVNALSKRQETQASLPLLGEQVKYYVQKTFGEQINNDLMQLEKQFKQSTLSADIKSKFEQLAKLEFDKVVSQQTGEKFKAETELLKVQNEVENVMKNLKGEELIQAQYLTSNWHRINNAMINLQNSQANQANSQAAVNKQLERFHKVSAELKEAGSTAELDSLLKEYRSKGQLSDADYEEAKRRLDVLDNVKGTRFLKKLDESLEWIKGKITIFH